MLHTLALMLMLGLHDAEATASDWYVVNDSVMGGVSTSEVVDDNGAVLFRGQLSLRITAGSHRRAPRPSRMTGRGWLASR